MRFITIAAILAVGAMMAALLMMTASPASTDHRDLDHIIFGQALSRLLCRAPARKTRRDW